MAKQYEKKKQVVIPEGGRIPPHSVETEEIVLGQILLEANAIESVVNFLKPESFYREAHGKIYDAMLDLYKKNEPINILTVSDALKKKFLLDSIGGIVYISQLTNKVSSAANIEFHGKILAQKFIQRELIRISSEIQTEVYEQDKDVADLLDNAEKKIFEIAEGSIRRDVVSIGAVFKTACDKIEEAGKKPEGLTGVISGFTRLDSITFGWQPSDMIIIAARPSVGKTAFVLSMLRNVAVERNIPVAMFSLEMDAVSLVMRMIVSESGLKRDKIMRGKLSSDEWTGLYKSTKKLVESPFYIDDTPALSISEFRAKCRRLKARYDVQLVAIDYLQLMTSYNAGTREQEVSYISRQIKAVAKELQIPIIALAQLNRSVEQRQVKKPMLSDLRESGSIEQDADLVLFLYRADYQQQSDDIQDGTRDLIQVIIAKHRNGGLGEVELKFVKETGRFTDFAFDNYQDYSNQSDNDNNTSKKEIIIRSPGFEDQNNSSADSHSNYYPQNEVPF